MRRGVVDASVAWTYTTWLNIAFLILAILFVWRFPKTGDAATLRMMNRPAAMGALSMEPSKSDSIKINLIGITRPIRISHQSSSRHHPIYPATMARKTQQSRTSIRLVSERDRNGQAAMRENAGVADAGS
jgi:hypothetical protein